MLKTGKKWKQKKSNICSLFLTPFHPRLIPLYLFGSWIVMCSAILPRYFWGILSSIRTASSLNKRDASCNLGHFMPCPWFNRRRFESSTTPLESWPPFFSRERANTPQKFLTRRWKQDDIISLSQTPWTVFDISRPPPNYPTRYCWRGRKDSRNGHPITITLGRNSQALCLVIVCSLIRFDLSMDSDLWAARLAAINRQYTLQQRNHSSHLGLMLCALYFILRFLCRVYFCFTL